MRHHGAMSRGTGILSVIRMLGDQVLHHNWRVCIEHRHGSIVLSIDSPRGPVFEASSRHLDDLFHRLLGA